jgi:hypothetical protein
VLLRDEHLVWVYSEEFRLVFRGCSGSTHFIFLSFLLYFITRYMGLGLSQCVYQEFSSYFVIHLIYIYHRFFYLQFKFTAHSALAFIALLSTIQCTNTDWICCSRCKLILRYVIPTVQPLRQTSHQSTIPLMLVVSSQLSTFLLAIADLHEVQGGLFNPCGVA